MQKFYKNLYYTLFCSLILIAFFSIDLWYLFYYDDETFEYGDYEIKLLAEKTTNEYSFQKTQFNTGVFDEVSNITFIVYSSGTHWRHSAISPHIRYYNHSLETWSAEKEIAVSPVEPDSHNYPSLIMDKEGFLHVFHTFHNNYEILYAKSNAPGI